MTNNLMADSYKVKTVSFIEIVIRDYKLGFTMYYEKNHGKGASPRQFQQTVKTHLFTTPLVIPM